ncbi:MAG: LamG domain-containing protein [Bacteroidetes bacterium]|nr:LamG domain-containing protein [Bacteroidota bacterium]
MFLGNYGDIDVGAEAIDRVAYVNIRNFTIINKENPANASGKITSVEIYAGIDMEGVIAATFSADGDNLTARDSYEIGSVTAGSKQTFTVDLDVEEGDYLGVYCTGGSIEKDSGGEYWYKKGNQTNCTNEGFSTTNGIISLYATGVIRQGGEVFTEFDADEDFDRIAFTSSDGVTQLYADCELFDVSENKAIYHVSKTGWTVSSSTDTDIYLYYDNTADHNTTYISKSGGTAAQSVWDSSFKAVYHMNDPDPTGTDELDDGFEDNNLTEYTAGSDVATASDQAKTGTYSAKFASDASTVLADATLVRNVGGTTNYSIVEFDVRTSNAYTTGNYLVRQPGYVLRIYNNKFQYYNNISWVDLPTSTACSVNTWYHVKVYVDAVNDIAMYWINENYKGTVTNCTIAAHDGIKIIGVYGGTSANTWIDNLKYTTYDAPVYRVADSTSNANHGTKKASNEPIEATGKVGQGQDFDGSDDGICIGSNNTFDTLGGDNYTVEAICKADTLPSESAIAIIVDLEGRIARIEANAAGSTWKYYYYDGGGYQLVTNNTNYTTGQYVYLAGGWDKANTDMYFYVDGGNVQTANETGDPDVSQDRANYLGRDFNSATSIFDGIIDEVRLSATLRSAAWIAATYDSLWDTLLTYGSEETSPTGETTNVLFIFSNV